MMLHFKRSSKTTALSLLSRPFSTTPESQQAPTPPPPRKVTPSSPLKMPKLQENEKVIGFRPYGNTSLQSKPKMFNFRL